MGGCGVQGFGEGSRAARLGLATNAQEGGVLWMVVMHATGMWGNLRMRSV